MTQELNSDQTKSRVPPWAIVRILGNELPPRDEPDSRVGTLGYILQNEGNLPYAHKLWVLNRVVNPKLQEAYAMMLWGYHEHRVLDIPWVQEEYCRAETFEQKMKACININHARNRAINWAHSLGYEWVMVMDGDCMWLEEDWMLFISEHQRNPGQPPYHYLTVPSARATLEGRELMVGNRLAECMIGFHRNSVLRFDEDLMFGQSDKQMLLRKLGHSILGYENQAKVAPDALTACYSRVIHIGTGDLLTEHDVNRRVRLRRQSLIDFFARLDASYHDKSAYLKEGEHGRREGEKGQGTTTT
jgi:hypothetical protein